MMWSVNHKNGEKKNIECTGVCGHSLVTPYTYVFCARVFLFVFFFFWGGGGVVFV